jgi:hypothetical protein
MSTSPITFRRRVRRGALALAVSAICLPSGSALAQGDTKADYPGTHQTAPVSIAGDTPADYPGTSGTVAPRSGDTPADYPGTSGTVAPKSGDTPADYPGTPGSPVVVEPVSGGGSGTGGFDWISAAIGAGGAGVLIIVALGGAAGASRLRMRVVRS